MLVVAILDMQIKRKLPLQQLAAIKILASNKSDWPSPTRW
jgi:hypothetical protein